MSPSSERSLHSTNTVTSARADARAQGNKISPYQPYLPASSSPYVPDDVSPEALTWAETVAPGGYTHKVVARGTRIRFEDLTGDACAHLLIFNADQPWERYNAADSVKIPWQVYPTTGHPLLSGDGRVLATIVEDISGHHDALCGTTSDVAIAAKFGDPSAHGRFPSGQALFEQAAAKHDLTLRDLPPSISFFKGVRVGEDGSTTFTGGTGAGAYTDLLAELPLIVLVANSSHPLDTSSDYVSGPLRIHAWRSTATTAQSDWYSRSPEQERSYLNSLDYAAAKGL